MRFRPLTKQFAHEEELREYYNGSTLYVSIIRKKGSSIKMNKKDKLTKRVKIK